MGQAADWPASDCCESRTMEEPVPRPGQTNSWSGPIPISRNSQSGPTIDKVKDLFKFPVYNRFTMSVTYPLYAAPRVYVSASLHLFVAQRHNLTLSSACNRPFSRNLHPESTFWHTQANSIELRHGNATFFQSGGVL